MPHDVDEMIFAEFPLAKDTAKRNESTAISCIQVCYIAKARITSFVIQFILSGAIVINSSSLLEVQRSCNHDRLYRTPRPDPSGSLETQRTFRFQNLTQDA